MNVRGVVMKVVDVGNQFKNEQEFKSCHQMLQWIHMEASMVGFGVVIGSFDNGLDRRCAFVTMMCERSEKHNTIRKYYISQGHL